MDPKHRSDDDPLFLAHDLGTTGDKATLVAADGTLLASVTAAYPVSWGERGKAEQHPDDWWAAFCRANHELIATSGIDPRRIAAVSFSGQMMGAALVDSNGRAVRPAVIWADTRAQTQTDRLVARVSMEEVYRTTGHRANPTYSLEKLMWIGDNEPEALQYAHRSLQAKEVIIARLTGEFVSEPSDASSTNAFDQTAGVWSDVLIEAAQVPASLFPTLVRSTDVVGTVRPEVAAEAGLPESVQVVAGGGDGPMGAFGAGILRPGHGGYAYLGSSSWVSYAAEAPLHDPDMRTMTFNHIVDGMFVPTGTMQAGGGALDWVVSSFMSSDDARFRTLLEEAAAVSAADEGLFFLPHLLGERSPYWNPNARGAFLGLTVAHSRAHMVRAVLEGIALNLRTCLDAYRDGGVNFDALQVIGGASKSPLMQQIMADYWGVRIVPSSIGDHVTSLGAAATAALGVGALSEDEVPRFVGAAKLATVHPSETPHREDRAAAHHARFVSGYRALEPWFDAAPAPVDPAESGAS